MSNRQMTYKIQKIEEIAQLGIVGAMVEEFRHGANSQMGAPLWADNRRGGALYAPAAQHD